MSSAWAAETGPDACEKAMPDPEVACPFLGMSGDPGTHARSPDQRHRCFRRGDTPIAIGELHQAAFCLTVAHEVCPVFGDAAGLAPAGQPREARLVPGLGQLKRLARRRPDGP